MYPGMGAAFWLKPRSRPCTNALLGILRGWAQGSYRAAPTPCHTQSDDRIRGGSPTPNLNVIFLGNFFLSAHWLISE